MECYAPVKMSEEDIEWTAMLWFPEYAIKGSKAKCKEYL